MYRQASAVIAPGSQLEERRLSDLGMRYLSMRPPNWDGERVVVAVHGISRNYLEHAELFLPECIAVGAALVVPRFSNIGYRGYQRLRKSKRGIRPDEALLEILDDARAVLGKPITSDLRLFGFSGGAQFVHRFSLAHPERVGRQALAAAGFYTFPTTTRKYPYGLGPVRHKDDGKDRNKPVLDPKGFLIPTKVFIGQNDTDRDEDLRVRAHLDKEQGTNRLVRARRFVLAVRAFSGRMRNSPDCSLSILNGCDHSFSTCVKEGMLARRAMQFLLPEAADRFQDPTEWP